MNHDAAVLLVRIIHAIFGAAKQTPAFIEGLVRDPRSLIMLAVTFAGEAASLLILIRSRRRSMIPRRCLLCLAALPPAARSPYCCVAHRAADSEPCCGGSMPRARCSLDRPASEIPCEPRAGPPPEQRPHRDWNQFDCLVRGPGIEVTGPLLLIPLEYPTGRTAESQLGHRPILSCKPDSFRSQRVITFSIATGTCRARERR
jgi:hypothetical protein